MTHSIGDGPEEGLARADAPSSRPADQAATRLDASRVDPSRKLFINRKEVCGALAMWAVRQSPYVVPDNLDAAIASTFDAMPDELEGWFWATEDELRQMVESICLHDQTIVSWNTPKSGHTASIVFSSRYDQPDPYDDIIDLYALANNIVRTIIADQYEDQVASAIETGTAETEGLGPKAESATAESRDAQTPSGDPS